MIDSFHSVHGINHTDGLQFALVTFATKARVECDFNSVNSLRDFDTCVDNAADNNGLSDIMAGLKIAESLILGDSGDRPDNPDLLVLVSDGCLTLGEPDPIPTADEIRSNDRQNATILSVGVKGFTGLDYSVLYQIAGNLSDHVLTVESAADLNETAESLVKLVACKPTCRAEISIVLETTELVDKHRSVGRGGEDFDKHRQAVLAIIDKLGASQHNFSGHHSQSAASNFYSFSHFSDPINGTKLTPESGQIFAMAPWSALQMHFDLDALTPGVGFTGGQCDLSLGLWLSLHDYNSSVAVFEQSPVFRFTILLAQGFQDDGFEYLAANASRLRKFVTATGGQVGPLIP